MKMEFRLFSVSWIFVFLLCVMYVLSTSDHANMIDSHDAFGTSKDSGVISVKGKSVMSTLMNRLKRSGSSGLVDIARFVDDSSSLITVYVDGTMKRFIFRVAVERSNPVIQITMPSGMPYSAVPSLQGKASAGDTVIATVDVVVNATDYGYWKFTKLDGNIWNVTIQAESPILIKQQLLDIGTNTPVTDPIVGSEYKLVVQATGYSNIKSIILGFLFSPSKVKPLTSFGPIVSKGNGKFEVAKVKMPAETFMVGVQGQDNSGHMFRRIDPTEITPSALKLDVPPYTGATMFEYSTFSIKFTVTNLLTTTQDIDVRISDPRGFSQAPTTLSATLKRGENFTGTFVIKSSFAYLSTLVKISAFRTYGHGNFSTGPVEYRNVSVIKNESTTTSTTTPSSPTTASTSTTSSTSPITTSSSKSSASSFTSVSNVSSASSAATGTTVVILSTGANISGSAVVTPSSSLSSWISTQSVISSNGNFTTKSKSFQSSVSGHTVTASVTQSTSSSNSSPGVPNVSHIATSTQSSGKGMGSTRNSPNTSNGMKTVTGSSGSTPSTYTSKDSSTSEISAGAIVASMVSGTIIGVAAITTMAIVFSKALSKKKRLIAPEDKKNIHEGPLNVSWT